MQRRTVRQLSVFKLILKKRDLVQFNDLGSTMRQRCADERKKGRKKEGGKKAYRCGLELADRLERRFQRVERDIVTIGIVIGLVVGAKVALAHKLPLAKAPGGCTEAASAATAGTERELPEVLDHLAVVEACVAGLSKTIFKIHTQNRRKGEFSVGLQAHQPCMQP